MPTPEGTGLAANSPIPLRETPSSSRASFASCPPEEGRDLQLLREGRSELLAPETTQPFPTSTDNANTRDGSRTVVQEPTPEPETDMQPRRTESRERQSAEDRRTQKGEHVEDAGTLADIPSPVGSPEAQSDSETKLAQSMATAVLGGQTTVDANEGPYYLAFPPLGRYRDAPHTISSFLRPGSKFRGTQQSDKQVYDVHVEIKDVDMAESFLCGYLRIQGLTDDHPTLTTFFEAEIIGPKYLFRTTNPSWNSSEKIDLQHWARFPAWRPLAKSAKNASSFTLKNYLDREHLFMRWKEYFLVPDHRVKSISGASFEGFYYICFDQKVGSVSGIYFHAKSEKYQRLELTHVDDGGCLSAVEFR